MARLLRKSWPMTHQHSCWLFWGLGLVSACESDIQAPIGGSGGSMTSSSSAGGANSCRGPDGAMICNGPLDCQPPPKECACLELVGEEYEDLGICTVTVVEWTSQLWNCVDGGVFIGQPGGESLLCAPWEMGMLFCDSNAKDLVWFADRGTFDCQPLPEPDVCAETVNLRLCGIACGSCLAGEICHGRSRLHPYGLCMPYAQNVCDLASPKCEAGESCFVYTVDPAAQPVADRWGVCLPQSLCEAAAAELPGGGSCHPAEVL